MLDPIADKILVGVALMMLVAEGTIDQFNLTTDLRSLLKLVPALIILTREILVSGLREFLAGAAVSVPVTRFAKFKTTIQMIAIGAMILGPIADTDRAAARSAIAYVAAVDRGRPHRLHRLLSICARVSHPYAAAPRRAPRDAPLLRLGAAEGRPGRRDDRAPARRAHRRRSRRVSARARRRLCRSLRRSGPRCARR